MVPPPRHQEAGITKITTVLFHMLGPSQHLVIGAAVGIGKVQLLMKVSAEFRNPCRLNTLRKQPSGGHLACLTTGNDFVKLNRLIMSLRSDSPDV